MSLLPRSRASRSDGLLVVPASRFVFGFMVRSSALIWAWSEY
jgi:hypothetical protein